MCRRKKEVTIFTIKTDYNCTYPEHNFPTDWWPGITHTLLYHNCYAVTLYLLGQFHRRRLTYEYLGTTTDLLLTFVLYVFFALKVAPSIYSIATCSKITPCILKRHLHQMSEVHFDDLSNFKQRWQCKDGYKVRYSGIVSASIAFTYALLSEPVCLITQVFPLWLNRALT